jgi:hypothetical protein
VIPLAFWFLVAFGLCYVVGHAKVSLGVREWLASHRRLRTVVELIECPACLGFWLGLVGGLCWPWLLPVGYPQWASAPLLGLATSASGYILGRATGWISED